MDAKEISEKHAKAEAARKGWAADMVSRVVAAGQSLIAKRDQVRMASAPERKTPFRNNQVEAVGRHDLGAQASGPRDIASIAAMDKDRQINNAVARARQLVEKKLASMPIISPDINYLRAEISRWDDHTGQPQTGRISFQIPFSGPQGDPRTIYAAVDLVLGDLMEPRTFSDGINNVYAFDTSGLKQLFQGQDFDVVHSPKVVPDTKYTSPDFHAPDGIGGSVAKDSPLLFRKASGEMTRQASASKPTIAREGLVRSLSKEANQIAPKEPAGVDLTKVRKPANAGTGNVGTSAESNTPYQQHMQGGQMDPTLASAEVREINWDGTIRSKAQGLDLKSATDLARSITYGGHDYVVEIWDGGKMVERVANALKGRAGANMRFATAQRVIEAGKSKHDQPEGDKPKAKGKTKAPAFDLVGAIMEFESGQLDDEGVLALFQHLVDTGMAWSLQGSYGRAAKQLLDQGLIRPANSDKSDAYGNTVPGKPRDDEGMGHPDSPSLEDEGKGLGSYESGARGTVRTASLSKVIKDLNLLDMRMISFRDLVVMCKQHGQASNISFDSASKELAKAGIIVYRTAAVASDNVLPYRLAHAQRERLAAPAPGTTAELPGAVPDAQEPGASVAPAAPGQPAPGGAAGTPEIAPPAGLDTVEFREFQALLDQYNNEWATVHEREMNNLKNGNAAHMGIDYTNLQTIYDKIDAFQQASKARKSEEIAGSPADLAAQPKTDAPPAPAEGPAAATNGNGSTTLMPEKGNGLAGQAPRLMSRASLAQALDMKEKGESIEDDAEQKIEKKATAYDLDDDAKIQMNNLGMDPGNPEQVKQFMGTFRKMSSQSQKFPEVCKNCKDLVVPNGYSALKEFKHTRLPFCGAAKKPGVGFVHAYFRDCVGYDPIVKDIAQKIEMKAPESDQTEKDSKKGQKPIMEHAGSKFAGTLTAESLPSADPKSVREKDGQTGVGLDIRKWCEQNGHYAPAGEVHPTHDWCTLWNTAVENLVMLPGGAVVPKSMSGQSSEPNGEGGPHQFGNTPNQVI